MDVVRRCVGAGVAVVLMAGLSVVALSTSAGAATAPAQEELSVCLTGGADCVNVPLPPSAAGLRSALQSAVIELCRALHCPYYAYAGFYDLSVATPGLDYLEADLSEDPCGVQLSLGLFNSLPPLAPELAGVSVALDTATCSHF